MTNSGSIADSNNPLRLLDGDQQNRVWSLDRATGSVNIQISIPTTPVGGRGPIIPYIFRYTSSSTTTISAPTFFESELGSTGFSQITPVWRWQTPSPTSSASVPHSPQGPWTSTFGPSLTILAESGTYTAGPTSSGPGPTSSTECETTGPYLFTDPTGQIHDLNLSTTRVLSGGGVGCSVPIPVTLQGTATDGSFVSAGITGFTPSGDLGYGPGNPGVVQSLLFPDGSRFSDTRQGSAVTAARFEDSNGNLALLAGGVWKDSAGRTIASAPFGVGSQDITQGTKSLDTTGVGGVTHSYSITAIGITPSWDFTFPHPTNSEISAMGSSEGTINQSASGLGSLNVISQLTLPDLRSYTFSYDPTYGTISKIIFPQGGYVRFAWGIRSFGARSLSGDAGATRIEKESTIVATDVFVSDGSTNESHWHYDYPDMSSDDGTLVTNETGPDGLRTYTYSPFAQAKLFHEGHDSYFETLRKESSSQGTVLRTVSTSYDQDANGSAGLPSGVVTTLYDGDAPLQSQVQFHRDKYGNIVEKDESAFYNCTTPTPCTSSPPWLRKTLTDYSWRTVPALADAHILSKPSQIIVTDGGGVYLAETDYSYDEFTLSPVADGVSNFDADAYPVSRTSGRGNLTTENSCLAFVANAGSTTCTQSVIRHKYYDVTGQVVRTTDARNNETSFIYTDRYSGAGAVSQTNAYPTTVTFANGASDQYTYDYSTGKQMSHTDWNNQVVSYSYDDPFDRLREMDSNVGTTMESHTTYDRSVLNLVTVKHDQKTKGDARLVTSTSVDGLGRVIRKTRVDGATIDTSYDATGNIQSMTIPYLLAGTVPVSATGFAYDALGRKKKQCQPDNLPSGPCKDDDTGSSYLSWTYSGNALTTKDENGGKSKQVVDALGKLASVTELGTAAKPFNLLTSYSYDALGNLLTVAQGGTVTELARNRQFQYDALSRLTSVCNPEGLLSGQSCDGAHWSTKYAYDANGNVSSKTDLRGMATDYVYDSLDHLTAKNFTRPDSSQTAACYQYDGTSSGSSVSNAKGRLVAEWTQAGVCPVSGDVPQSATTWRKVGEYDANGSITQETQCAIYPCSAVNPISYTYDLTGTVTRSTNGVPASSSNGLYVTFDHDGHGNLSTVDSSDISPQPQRLFEATTYGAFGLEGARYAINTDTSLAGFTQVWTHDVRGRISDTDALGATTPPTQGADDPTVSLNLNPVSEGEYPVFTSSCLTACGSSFQAAHFEVDHQYVGGSGYMPGDKIGGGLSTPLNQGQHSLQVFYDGDSTHGPQQTQLLTFTVVANNLPHLALGVNASISFDAAPPIPLGQSADVIITLPCGSHCGEGQMTIDGAYAGSLHFDEAGVAGNTIPSTLTAGTHHLVVNYWGDASYSNGDLPFDFAVTDQGLTPVPIQVSIEPSAIPEGEFGTARISIPCGMDCRGGHFFIDGAYAGGYLVDSSGSTNVSIPRDLQQSTSHNFEVRYYGDVHNGPNVQSFPFSVIANTLPETTLGLSVSVPPAQANTWIPVTVTATANGVPCSGSGYLIVDGTSSRPFELDGSGTGPTLAFPLTAGPHSMAADYYGTEACRQKISDPQTFQVQP